VLKGERAYEQHPVYVLKADYGSKRDCERKREVEVEVDGKQEQGDDAEGDVEDLEEGGQQIGSAPFTGC